MLRGRPVPRSEMVLVRPITKTAKIDLGQGNDEMFVEGNKVREFAVLD